MKVSHLVVGDRWFLHLHDGTFQRVKIVAIETGHVLVEVDGKENRWGGPERCWYPRGVFESVVDRAYQ